MHTLGHFNVKVAHQTHNNPFYSNSVCEAFTRVAINHLKEGQRRLIGRSLRMLIPLTRNMCVYLLHETQFCTSCVRSSAMTPGGGLFSSGDSRARSPSHRPCFMLLFLLSKYRTEAGAYMVCMCTPLHSPQHASDVSQAASRRGGLSRGGEGRGVWTDEWMTGSRPKQH